LVAGFATASATIGPRVAICLPYQAAPRPSLEASSHGFTRSFEGENSMVLADNFQAVPKGSHQQHSHSSMVVFG